MMWGDRCERPRPLSFTSFSSSPKEGANAYPRLSTCWP